MKIKRNRDAWYIFTIVLSKKCWLILWKKKALYYKKQKKKQKKDTSSVNFKIANKLLYQFGNQKAYSPLVPSDISLENCDENCKNKNVICG